MQTRLFTVCLYWAAGSTEEGIHGTEGHLNCLSMGYGLLEDSRNKYCGGISPRALLPSGELGTARAAMNGYDHERHRGRPEDSLNRTRSWPQLCSAQEQVGLTSCPAFRSSGVRLGIRGLFHIETAGEQEVHEEAKSTGVVLREHSDSALTVSPSALQRLSSSPSQVHFRPASGRA